MNIITEKNGFNLDIDKKETYRYLGYHFGGEVSVNDELEKIVDELTAKLKENITPRCIYEIYKLTVDENTCKLYQYHMDNNTASSDNVFLSINSQKLSAHIKECRYAILFAATIGPGADMLIRRYSGRSTVKSAILQAAGAAAIEAFADEVTEQIRTEIDILFSQSETKFKMRFSPGYGDFSLEHQKDFFKLLQLEKNLGMSLNSALLMSPSKSITAVIGVL